MRVRRPTTKSRSPGTLDEHEKFIIALVAEGMIDIWIGVHI